jgi:hypothetical protein
LNSGSSSRKRTPLWARLTSPGRGNEPPPTTAASLAVWWGLRKGLSVSRASSRAPPAEWIAVVSNASSGVSGGRIPGSRRASIVLPEPGGPERSRL